MNPNLTQVVQQLTQVKAEIDELTEIKNQLEDAIRQAIPMGTSRQVAGLKVSVSHPIERLNNKMIQAAYPPEAHPEYYKPTLNTQAVKKHISHDQLQAEGLLTLGAPMVKLS